MWSPKEYKVYKGLNKEIRFLYLERTIARQFMLASIGVTVSLFFFLGMNSLTFLLAICGIVLTYIYFKNIDVKNTKHNLKKQTINSKKPLIIRTTKTVVEKHDGSLFDKR